jgi:WD40 repeat protein
MRYLRIIRLRGHRDQITEIRFLSFADERPSTSAAAVAGLLLTASKDTFMKLWDLSTQHCIQTVVAHRSEIWSLDVNLEMGMLFTGSGEGELKAWKIDRDAITRGLNQTETGEVNLYERKSCYNMLFILLLISPDQEDDTSHVRTSIGIQASCIAVKISFFPALPCRSVSRSFCGDIPD